MASSTYRLLRETSVVVTKDGKPNILTIPNGSIITVQEPPSKDTPLVPVKFGSITVKMFAIDLEQRTELVNYARS